MHDAIMRGLGMAAEISKTNPDFETLLDIGGANKSQSSYFPGRNIYVLNIKDYNVDKKIHFVKGSMMNIPFRNNSFDIVVSNDTLEHINKEDREKGIKEMIRVAKKFVVIGVPCGKAALKYERIILKIGRLFGKKMKWLTEHQKAKLPMENEIIKIIQKNQKVKNLKINKNNNIYFWFITSLLGPLIRPLWNIFNKKSLFKLWWFFSLLNFGKTYRKFFVIYLK
jgi:hypothetical protein